MKRKTKIAQILIHIPVPLVFVISYLAGMGLQLVVPIIVSSSQLSLVLVVAGLLLFLAGLILALWCLFIFYKEHTTTVPGKKSDKLVQWGPYDLSRNPMYVSMILMYIGGVGILSEFWALILLPLTIVYVNWLVIPYEESQLNEVFGENFEKYCSKVPRWF